MRPQLILLGAPGSGKGTQASKLVEVFGYAHVSTGDLLRTEIQKNSELGKRVQSIMNAGNLVDDATVLELLKVNCDLDKRSYIFDGFPRNIEQAESLDQVVLLSRPSLALYFDIDLEIIVERVINRRVAPKSGEIYNLISRPPKVAGKCDVSGEDLVFRKDDNEDTVRNRLQVFKETIEPVLEYYRNKGILKTVDAAKSSTEVLNQLKMFIES